MNPIKIILTGSTGMVGEGILMECLETPDISEILSVSRKPSGKKYAKLREYIPGCMKPIEGQKNEKWFFSPFIWIFPMAFPSKSLTLREVGMAIINAVLKGYPTSTLEIKDIKNLAL